MAWLDLTGLSGYTSLSRRTLQKYLTHPVCPLPAYRVGNKWLFDSAEVDQWVKGFTRGQQDVGQLVDEILGGLEDQQNQKQRPGNREKRSSARHR